MTPAGLGIVFISQLNRITLVWSLQMTFRAVDFVEVDIGCCGHVGVDERQILLAGVICQCYAADREDKQGDAYCYFHYPRQSTFLLN